jgi:putative ABC transport system substrate-binding protein
MRRIACLYPAVRPAGPSSTSEAFEERLAQLGWTKDKNIRIEYGYTGGQQETVSSVVSEALGSGPDVVVTWGPPLSLATKQATTQIPQIFIIVFDPVDLGLVSNLARPGGNLTGVTGLANLEIFAKRLQLVKEMVPSLTRIAILLSTERTRSTSASDALKRASATLGISLVDVGVQSLSDLETAIQGAKSLDVQAVYVWPSGFTFSFAREISEVAIANRLPTIHSFREAVSSGGLLAYGVDVKEAARIGAAYVDKILRGATPGNLPIEQMSKYDLIINLKTAKTLGLEIPPQVLARADEVIE